MKKFLLITSMTLTATGLAYADNSVDLSGASNSGDDSYLNQDYGTSNEGLQQNSDSMRQDMEGDYGYDLDELNGDLEYGGKKDTPDLDSAPQDTEEEIDGLDKENNSGNLGE